MIIIIIIIIIMETLFIDYYDIYNYKDKPHFTGSSSMST